MGKTVLWKRRGEGNQSLRVDGGGGGGRRSMEEKHIRWLTAVCCDVRGQK